MKNYRHGDLVLIGIDSIDDSDLEPQKEIHGGSHGHHRYGVRFVNEDKVYKIENIEVPPDKEIEKK